MNLAMLSGKHKTNCQFIACCINLGHNVQCIMNTDFHVVDVNMLVFKKNILDFTRRPFLLPKQGQHILTVYNFLMLYVFSNNNCNSSKDA